MGVYLNTFRTESKTALFNGEPVKVFAYRFLCRANDAEPGIFSRNSRRANLLQAQCEQAAKRFDAHKPAFAACVFEDSWDGVTIYANPKGACHYDTEGLTKEPIGFLCQLPGKRAYDKGAKGWVITGERHGEDNPMVAGLTVRRSYIERLHAGAYSLTPKSYRFSNGTVFTPDQFAAWRVTAEAEYLAACQRAQEAQAAKDAETARLRQVKVDAKNAEILAARETLAKLERERTLI